jgi:hypothetical protein
MNKLVALAVLVSLCLLYIPAFGQDKSTPGDFVIGDDSLNQRYDWVITVNVKILKDYLNYPTSNLAPMTKLSVVYRQTARLNQNQNRNTDPVQFEDLWYHECSVVGCRRYNPLGLTPGEQGAIRIIPSDDASQSSCAIANAVTRLLLDVGLLRCALTAVYVPIDAVDAVVADFAKFNFVSQTPSPEKSIRSSMLLFICSDPPRTKKYLYYMGP